MAEAPSTEEAGQMGWGFAVADNGQVVAMGDAPDRDTAIREAGHYLMMYGQDGGDVRSIVCEGSDEDCTFFDGDTMCGCPTCVATHHLTKVL
jgi:hypothetical protein